MDMEKWNLLLQCAHMKKTESIPVALIADSPWIPGYTGVSTIDYYTDVDIWFEGQTKIRHDFPEVIFIPDYWVEFGMAAEPSGFGCKPSFYLNSPITITNLASDYEDISWLCKLPVPNPERDGLMPLVLSLYKKVNKRIQDAGEQIKIVASRGPLNIATHLMGVTEFLLAMRLDPDNTHRLLKKTTAMAKAWLEAQANVLKHTDGIMILDDIIGFLSEDDYEEFAHPYLKELISAFPVSVKILHNDTDNPISYSRLSDIGVNIFNFTHLRKLSEVRKLTGNKVCLMGNLPPLQVLVEGSPEIVAKETCQRLEDWGNNNGLILSAGGGVSPGTQYINIRTMINALKT